MKLVLQANVCATVLLLSPLLWNSPLDTASPIVTEHNRITDSFACHLGLPGNARVHGKKINVRSTYFVNLTCLNLNLTCF